MLSSVALFSHFWFAIPQLVLQADWQEVWHSPQPPFFALLQRFFVLIVVILFMDVYLRFTFYILTKCIIPHRFADVNTFCVIYAERKPNTLNA